MNQFNDIYSYRKIINNKEISNYKIKEILTFPMAVWRRNGKSKVKI